MWKGFKGKKIECPDCNKSVPKNSSNQKRCKKCAYINSLKKSRERARWMQKEFPWICRAQNRKSYRKHREKVIERVKKYKAKHRENSVSTKAPSGIRPEDDTFYV